MNQSIITKIVQIATKQALNGNPVDDIIYHPTTKSTNNPNGTFIIISKNKTLKSTDINSGNN